MYFFKLISTGNCIYNAGPRVFLKYAYDHGHLIGSHTWAHRNLSNLTFNQSTLFHVAVLLIYHIVLYYPVHDEMFRTEGEYSVPVMNSYLHFSV